MSSSDYHPHALRYLLLWLDRDRDFLLALRNKAMPRKERLQQLRRATSTYSVARNLRGGPTDNAPTRYAPLLQILDALPADLPRRGYANVDFTANRIRRAYQESNGLNSLSSKLLWLRFGRPFLVYDKRARTELGTPPDDLNEFEKVWRARFRQDRPAITSACAQLPEVLSFMPASVPHNEIRRAIQARWFHERVLDQALWKGSAQNQHR